MANYTVLTGINYTPSRGSDEVRARPRDTVDDLTVAAAKQLLEAGAITASDGDVEPVYDEPEPPPDDDDDVSDAAGDDEPEGDDA